MTGKYIPAKKAGEILGINNRTLIEMAKDGTIPEEACILVNKYYRFDVEAVEKALRPKQQQEPQEEVDITEPQKYILG